MPGDMELQQKFDLYKTALKARYGNAAYDHWFKPLSLVRVQNGSAVIGAPSAFCASRITANYSRGMFELWPKYMGPIGQISIRGIKSIRQHANDTAQRASEYREDDIPGGGAGPMPHKMAETFRKSSSGQAGPEKVSAGRTTISRRDDLVREGQAAPLPSGTSLASPLHADFTFERFCLGEANRVAFLGARSIVDGSDDNMFFVYGSSGRGKTHLLNAIGHDWKLRRPDDNVLYLTHDNLLNGYVTAVLAKNVNDLRDYLDGVDIILIDDIHLLRGRKATQDELLHLIDRLLAYGKTIVIAGSLAPSRLAETGLNQRLTDRMGGGVCVPIDKPDYQLRMKILKQMAALDAAHGGFVCEETFLQMIARSCDASIRELEGAYKMIRLHTRAEQEKDSTATLDEAEVRKLLRRHLSSRPRETSLEDLMSATAEAFDLSTHDIMGRKRMQPIARGRHAFCLLARRLTSAPLKAIGAIISRDHTTVLSSIERAEVLAETDPHFGDLISSLMDEFEH
ncbi:MAG: DnaA/Hda family protein [Aquisalinus sp.]|nr:DnaA/Hda family protein [Aquisalinus sp.]